jgi:hypothetical protein
MTAAFKEQKFADAAQFYHRSDLNLSEIIATCTEVS